MVILGGLGGVNRGVNGVRLGVFRVWTRDLGSGVCSGVGGRWRFGVGLGVVMWKEVIRLSLGKVVRL